MRQSRLQFLGHSYTVRDVHFAGPSLRGAAGERLVISCSDDRTIRIWSRDRAEPLGVTELSGPPANITLHHAHREVPVEGAEQPEPGADLFVVVRTGQVLVMQYENFSATFQPFKIYGEV